jgi:REP element-mobilizing transposase RayT
MYFVTVCTQWRDRCLGDVADGEARPSPCGEVVAREWRRIPGRYPRVKLDAWIIMPDHLHGILILEPAPDSLAASLGIVVGQFKTKSTKAVRGMGYRGFAWQERFHEHIIETLEELERVRAYIQQNPQRWEAKRLTDAHGATADRKRDTGPAPGRQRDTAHGTTPGRKRDIGP